MTEGSAKGFWMSASLHGAVAAAFFIFGFVLKSEEAEQPTVFELVAGEGDNYLAREAPALGVPGGVKVDIPEAPEPTPSPPSSPPRESVPVVTPPPATPEPPKKAPVLDFKKQLQQEVRKANTQAKREIARERAAEKKRLEQERKRAEEEKKRREDAEKRMTKEEFDRLNKGKTPSSSKSSITKVAQIRKIDSEGIAKGVVGGSTRNKEGGAGGKALTSDNDDVLGAYYAMFKLRLRAEFLPPPNVSDSLKVTIEVLSHADGGLSNPRVVKSSGDDEFDRAVIEAVRRVRMPARPDKKRTELVDLIFTMRERTEG